MNFHYCHKCMLSSKPSCYYFIAVMNHLLLLNHHTVHSVIYIFVFIDVLMNKHLF